MLAQIVIGTVSAQNPEVALHVEANRTEIYENECVVITASLIVAFDRTVLVKFKDDLAQQAVLMHDRVVQDNVIKYMNNITAVKGERKDVYGKSYYSYKLLEMAMCPIANENIIVPKLKLTLLKLSHPEDKGENFDIYSEPLKVLVKKIDDNVVDSIYTNEFYKMIGDFHLSETVLKKDRWRVGDSIEYTLRIKGRGVGNMIESNVKNNPGIVFIPISIKSNDTIRYEDIRLEREFKFRIVFTQPGNYDLSRLVNWRYYSVEEEKTKLLASRAKFMVAGESSDSQKEIELEITEAREVVIALDVSESMLVQDYKPNRMEAIKYTLEEFVEKFKYNEPIIAYAGEAKSVSLDTLSKVNHTHFKSGTAIGEAIWEAVKIFKKHNVANKTLVIFGDGDSTAGFISADLAAKLANRYDIRIISVGVGNYGQVLFGLDYFGQERYVDKTYNENALRKIASITKGKFYKFENPEPILDILGSLMVK